MRRPRSGYDKTRGQRLSRLGQGKCDTGSASAYPRLFEDRTGRRTGPGGPGCRGRDVRRGSRTDRRLCRQQLIRASSSGRDLALDTRLFVHLDKWMAVAAFALFRPRPVFVPMSGELVVEVLRENEPMLQICRKLGFSIVPQPGDPAIMLVRKFLPRRERIDLDQRATTGNASTAPSGKAAIGMARVTLSQLCEAHPPSQPSRPFSAVPDRLAPSKAVVAAAYACEKPVRRRDPLAGATGPEAPT